MRNKIVKIIECNRLVLNNCSANYCEKGFNELSMIKLWIFLLNYCNEQIARNFMVNYRYEHPTSYLD